MPQRLIDANALHAKIMKDHDNDLSKKENIAQILLRIETAPTVEAEPVNHGYWIECDYKTLEHGEIESAYKAGLCCSECRTGFKKSKMTFKQYCAACGAVMDAEPPKRGAENGTT